VQAGRQSVPTSVRDGWGGLHMGKVTVGLVLLVVLLVLGGGIFLTVWIPPAPSRAVEKVIPHARFAPNAQFTS
jgi:hypothetical protein